MSISYRDIIRTLVFVLFGILCLTQCYTIMKGFIQYPSVIDIYDVNPNLIRVLPGVTICNNNRLSLRKVADRNRKISRAIGDKFPNWFKGDHHFFSNSDFHNFRDEVARVLEQVKYDPQAVMDNSTLDDLFNLKPDTKSFLRWLECARTWSESLECSMLTHIDSIQDRRCTTLLHKGAMLYDTINNPHLFNNTQSTAGLYHYFDAKEVVKMMLDFKPEDYADLKRQIGGRVIFHSDEYVASATDLDFFVTRGYRYDFNIDREDVVLLEKPYSNCINYESNLDKYEDYIDPRIPLTDTTCFQNCIVKNIVYSSKCWPPTMPYFRNDSLDLHRNLKACNWIREAHHISVHREIMRLEKIKKNKNSSVAEMTNGLANLNKEAVIQNRNYQKIRRHCWTKCPYDCRWIKYSVTVTRSVWPPDNKLLFDEGGQQKILRHCCALVAIKYTHFHYNIQQYKPKYNLTDTVGNVGGLLAVWLGLSMVSVYRAIQKLVELCNRRNNSRVGPRSDYV